MKAAQYAALRKGPVILHEPIGRPAAANVRALNTRSSIAHLHSSVGEGALRRAGCCQNLHKSFQRGELFTSQNIWMAGSE